MFVQLSSGEYVNKDLIGHVTLKQRLENGIKHKYAVIHDKRGANLGTLDFHTWGSNFWDTPEGVIVHASGDFKTIDFDCGEVFGFNQVVAWYVYYETSVGPEPITVWGRADASAILQPDGRVFYQDAEYESLAAFKKEVAERYEQQKAVK